MIRDIIFSAAAQSTSYGTPLISWQTVTLPTATDSNGGNVFYLFSTYIIAGNNTYYSSDASSWTAGTAGTSGNYFAASSSRIVGANYNANTTFSTNGTTWSAGGSISGIDVISMAYGGTSSLYVATGGSGANFLINGTCLNASSPDGVTWTQRPFTVSSAEASDWWDVAANSSIFVMASMSGAATRGTIFTSTTGTTWTRATISGLTGATTFWALKYVNSQFVLLATSNSTLFYATSPDASTWTVNSQANNYVQFAPVAGLARQAGTAFDFGSAIYTAPGTYAGNNGIWATKDFISWSFSPLSDLPTNGGYANGKFLYFVAGTSTLFVGTPI